MSETPDLAPAPQNQGLVLSPSKLIPWLRRAPLLPEAGAAGKPLIVVIAVICFLASISLASVIAVSKAASEWTNDLRGSVTVQIKGENSDVITRDTEAVLSFLQSKEGVIAARALSRTETAELLEPWLGKNNLPASVPVPSLIELEIDTKLRDRITILAQELEDIAPNISLDDHSTWNDTLASSARTAQAFAFAVFLLIMLAVCTTIIFATKAGLSANREIVDVLHLVGATDGFIAQEVQRRFLLLGLRGALLGTVVAIFAILLATFTISEEARNSYFLPTIETGFSLYIWMLIVPLLTCLVAAFTARMTVMNTLSQRF